MANATDIYGLIGAAKAFNSSVAYSLDLDVDATDKKIAELEEELKTKVGKEAKKIQRDIKRLKMRNKLTNLQAKASKAATDFLTKICSYMDIGIATIIKWLSKVIVEILPPLEVTVKLILLSNIKKMVNCAMDPRIPNYWREEGVYFNEAMLDPRMILKASPYSKWGKYNYFGTYYDKEKLIERETFELARADDMNAFLWFAKNCVNFVEPNIVGEDLSEYFDLPQGATGITLFNTHEFKEKKDRRFVVGSTFKYDNGNTTFLCIKKDIRTNGVFYTIVPATDKREGINWYKDRNSISDTGERYELNPYKSKPLFNIEYIGVHRDDSPYSTLYPDGNFKFRILPKPFSTAGGFIVNLKNNINTLSDMANSVTDVYPVVGTEIYAINTITGNPLRFEGIQSPIPYTARFDEYGIYDKRGRYSIDMRKYYVVQDNDFSNDYIIYYDIINVNGAVGEQPIAYLKFNKESKIFSLVDAKTGDNHQITEKDVSFTTAAQILTECYTGNTVYEFNYDYVVSMRLFDAKEIATGIVDSLMNIHAPNPFKRSRQDENGNDADTVTNTDQIRIDSYVDKLVEKMIDTEDGEYTDCFYSFSNEDYGRMEQDVADKVANSTLATDSGTDSIQAIYDVIDSYDADATLNERIETISLALTKAANACGFSDAGDLGGNVGSDYSTSGGEKESIENFITQAVKFLTSAIVNSILTPKVLMLIQVNRMMMGTDAIPKSKEEFLERYNFNVEQLLDSLYGVLSGIIKEIINTIQKELLRLILVRLREMMNAYLKRLGHEYAMKWVLLLKQLISCFKLSREKGNASDNRLYSNQYKDAINNIIDKVDYADIDVLIDEIIPKTNPC